MLRVITTGETASSAGGSVDVVPTSKVASGMSGDGDSSIRLPSDDRSSQSFTATRIVAMSEQDRGWAEVTSNALYAIWSWSTAALKNLRNGAYSGLPVTM